MSSEPNFQQVCETLRQRGKELQSMEAFTSAIYHQMWNERAWDTSFLWGHLPKEKRGEMCHAFQQGLFEGASGKQPRSGDAVAAALHFASENAELKALLKDLREELREENQNPFKLGDLLDRAANLLGKEGE